MKLSRKQLNDALCKLPDPYLAWHDRKVPDVVKIPIFNSELKFLQDEPIPQSCKITELTFRLDMKDHMDWVITDLKEFIRSDLNS